MKELERLQQWDEVDTQSESPRLPFTYMYILSVIRYLGVMKQIFIKRC